MIKKKFIISIILAIIIFIIIIAIVKNLYNNKDSLEYKENILKNNLESNMDNRIMLADILKEPNELVLTEDNSDNSNKIIERANLKSGVFIAENSRTKFLEIINTATESNYSINTEGYLVASTSRGKKSDLSEKIDNYINSEKLMVINISSTYKGLLNNMLLDFMIEKTSYVQLFQYNDNIKIALINPDKINEESEDLTQKEIYEEILLML